MGAPSDGVVAVTNQPCSNGAAACAARKAAASSALSRSVGSGLPFTRKMGDLTLLVAALAWLFSDEGTAAVDSGFSRVTASGARVPTLWRLEVANSLTMAVRRQRITADFRDQSLVLLVMGSGLPFNQGKWET
jgi:hypothetical protein